MEELLNAIFALLNSLSSQPEMAQTGFALMLGVAVFTLMIAAILIGTGLTHPVRRRLRRLVPASEETAAKPAGLRQAVESVGDAVSPRDEATKVRTKERLRHAGIRAQGAAGTYYGARLLLSLVLVVTVVVAVSATSIPAAPQAMFVVAAALAGYLAPSFWLDWVVRRRTGRIRRALPDALDLLVVCTEAGLGLSSAIQRVASDLGVSHPELAEELRIFNMQIRAGMDNRSALRDLEARTGVEDVRGLVTTLLQSMRFGTSVASTLRIYSEELRDKRMQRAEEYAAKVGTKMLFPLVLCIFPSFFVVTLGPPILGAIAALSGAR